MELREGPAPPPQRSAMVSAEKYATTWTLQVFHEGPALRPPRARRGAAADPCPGGDSREREKTASFLNRRRRSPVRDRHCARPVQCGATALPLLLPRTL